MNVPDDVGLRLLRELGRQPLVSQRSLAKRTGLSLGKLNYCLRALVAKGLVKTDNFRRSDNKMAYVYVLTPSGFQEKARLTFAFLRSKEAEYERIQAEISELQAEVAQMRSQFEEVSESTKGQP